MIVPGSTRNLKWCASFKGKLSVFSACFTRKYWTVSKLFVLTCFTLNLPWTSSWQLIFRLLVISIIVPGYTRILRQRISFLGDFSLFSARFTQTAFRLSVITCFPLNLPRNYSWNLLYSLFFVCNNFPRIYDKYTMAYVI